MFFPNYNHIGLPELLIIVFIISLFFIINYYFRNIFPISSFKLDSIEENKILEPVSIIICARNEEDNLTEFLPKILTIPTP